MAKQKADRALYYIIDDPDGDGDARIIVGEQGGKLLFRESVGIASQTQAQVSARGLLKQRGVDPSLADWVENPQDDPRVRHLRDEHKSEIDRGLIDPKRLAQRKIAGEHLCVFCAHDVVCEISNATRRNAALCVVISGCIAFDLAGAE